MRRIVLQGWWRQQKDAVQSWRLHHRAATSKARGEEAMRRAGVRMQMAALVGGWLQWTRCVKGAAGLQVAATKLQAKANDASRGLQVPSP